MEINIEDLQKVISLLLSNLKKSAGDVVEIQGDYYWDIPSEDLYNPYEEPKLLTLGQLSQDFAEIQKLVKDPQDAVPYDLNRISTILKALSVENPTCF
jgi:hypothetical protein